MGRRGLWRTCLAGHVRASSSDLNGLTSRCSGKIVLLKQSNTLYATRFQELGGTLLLGNVGSGCMDAVQNPKTEAKGGTVAIC